jgi:DegV family protein with EDD domain
MGEGFAALEAARAAAEGDDLEEVVRRAEDVSRRVHTIFVLKTLEYLVHTGRGGRKAMRMASSALNVKPIVCLDGGKVGFLGMPRVWHKALSFMLKAMQKQVGDRPVHVAVMHADAPDEAERLRERVANRFNCLELLTTEFSPVMGGSAGPGTVGVAFYCEDSITGETESNLEEV